MKLLISIILSAIILLFIIGCENENLRSNGPNEYGGLGTCELIYGDDKKGDSYYSKNQTNRIVDVKIPENDDEALQIIKDNFKSQNPVDIMQIWGLTTSPYDENNWDRFVVEYRDEETSYAGTPYKPGWYAYISTKDYQGFRLYISNKGKLVSYKQEEC